MKIVIIQGAFLPVPPREGGAVEKIWYRMGQEFAALGHEVLHISRAYADLPNHEKLRGVEYRRVPGYETPASLLKLKLLDLRYSLRAVRRIPDDADIIVTNTFWSPLLLRGRQGRKVYVNVERVPKGQMRFYGHTGRIRGGSQAICEAVRRETSTARHGLVSLVRNPVPFDVKPLVTAREKTILFVGRLHPEKGVHVLLEAFAQLEQAGYTSWKLLIVGPHAVPAGGGGEAYRQDLVRQAAGHNVEFVGAVYDEDALASYYARASVFCYPAQDGSGDASPVAPREAMAYGCVPVLSQLACFADLVAGGTTGITFNQQSAAQAQALAQALEELMRDEARLHRLSEAGQAAMHHYAPRVVAEAFVRDFESMLVASAG